MFFLKYHVRFFKSCCFLRFFDSDETIQTTQIDDDRVSVGEAEIVIGSKSNFDLTIEDSSPQIVEASLNAAGQIATNSLNTAKGLIDTSAILSDSNNQRAADLIAGTQELLELQTESSRGFLSEVLDKFTKRVQGTSLEQGSQVTDALKFVAVTAGVSILGYFGMKAYIK